MPTKARREREQAKRRANEQLSRPPPHIKARVDARCLSNQKTKFDELVEAFADDPPHTRLGEGLVEYDERGGLAARTDLMRSKYENTANDLRHDKRQQDIKALKKRYLSIWGRPGGARTIATNEGLSVRTVQEYFKDFP